jgi:hypothetical protein
MGVIPESTAERLPIDVAYRGYDPPRCAARTARSASKARGMIETQPLAPWIVEEDARAASVCLGAISFPEWDRNVSHAATVLQVRWRWTAQVIENGGPGRIRTCNQTVMSRRL